MAGYLDLLQRELRDAVIHPFGSLGDLAAAPGVEGQIASTDGAFYIFAAGAWKRIADETDIALLRAEQDRKATVYTVTIPASSGSAGSFPVPHGFEDRPSVEVSGPDGAVVSVDIVHADGAGRCQVVWVGTLPTPAVVTCLGMPLPVTFGG